MPINSKEVSGKSLHFVLVVAFAFPRACVKPRMVRIKHIAHPRVLPEPLPMDSNDEMVVPSSEMKGPPDTSSSPSPDDSKDYESRSGDSGSTTFESDESSWTKVAAAAAVVGIVYDFGLSTIGKARITFLESCVHYFPWGYCRALGMESVPQPQPDEDVVFEDFFMVRLRLPPHLVLTEILQKFRFQLHQLTPNAIVQIRKFIWAISSCGGHLTVDVFAMHYELHYQ
jgi:hypothetical protein